MVIVEMELIQQGKKKQLEGRINEEMFLLFNYIFDKCKW
jgi:hypothetical protein